MHIEANRSRSSKVTYFCTNRKHICNILLVCHSKLGTILPRFRDIAGLLLKKYPRPNLVDVPFGLWRPCWGQYEQEP